MNNRLVGLFVAGAMAALLAVPALAALVPGATAPDFTATASQAGKDFTFSLKQALAKGPVVVYFFPAAYTGGCDLEAHTFAQEKAKFVKAGATIIGVSEDSVARLNEFSSDPKYCAGKFAVVSDPGGKIAAQYGVKRFPPQKGVIDVRGQPVTHGFFARTTFVLNREGNVVKVLSSEADHLTPVQHVTESLASVENLQANRAP
ncbi:MAG: peroxiredoxin [Rhodanobacteraceae bacterium]